MRLFALSDIHTDYDENWHWVEKISRVEHLNDVLILAGDISDSVDNITRCLERCVSCFYRVFYLPGNHELWVGRESKENSVEKYNRLLRLAESLGACVRRATVGDVDIVPMHSWYDFSFGVPSQELLSRWMDFYQCRWPEELKSNRDICQHFLHRNQDISPGSRQIISFSHFLPRLDLMPSYIPLRYRFVYPVLGTWALDEQIRALGSCTHIYGHSHVNRDVVIDGVRYINNAFGYPSEHWTRKALVCLNSR